MPDTLQGEGLSYPKRVIEKTPWTWWLVVNRGAAGGLTANCGLLNMDRMMWNGITKQLYYIDPLEVVHDE